MSDYARAATPVENKQSSRKVRGLRTRLSLRRIGVAIKVAHAAARQHSKRRPRTFLIMLMLVGNETELSAAASDISPPSRLPLA